MWAHAGLRSLRLRGAGDGAVKEGGGAGAGTGELFDGLMQQDKNNRIDFLAEAFAGGDAAAREQAVGYTTLLMSEEGFLDNMTPLQLLSLCIKAPELVRACSSSFADDADNGEVPAGPLQTMLSGLPEAIDVLSLRALLKHSNSSINRDIAALPAGGSVQEAVRVLLECPGFCERMAASDMWSHERTEHTVLGALMRRSPMEDLSHWEEVGEQIQVGDSLEAAIERSTSEMQALQQAWEENQAASAELIRALFDSPCFNHSLLIDWFQVTLHNGRERTTEAARMQLLGGAVMPDGVALNLLDVCLRVYEPELQAEGARGDAEVDWSYSYSEHAHIVFDSDPLFRPHDDDDDDDDAAADNSSEHETAAAAAAPSSTNNQPASSTIGTPPAGAGELSPAGSRDSLARAQTGGACEADGAGGAGGVGGVDGAGGAGGAGMAAGAAATSSTTERFFMTLCALEGADLTHWWDASRRDEPKPQTLKPKPQTPNPKP